jgi:hypothetical protein
MTNAAEINSERQLCHDPEGGAKGQSLVGEGGALAVREADG